MVNGCKWWYADAQYLFRCFTYWTFGTGLSDVPVDSPFDKRIALHDGDFVVNPIIHHPFFFIKIGLQKLNHQYIPNSFCGFVIVGLNLGLQPLTNMSEKANGTSCLKQGHHTTLVKDHHRISHMPGWKTSEIGKSLGSFFNYQHIQRSNISISYHFLPLTSHQHILPSIHLWGAIATHPLPWCFWHVITGWSEW